MTNAPAYTAFEGYALLAAGDAATVAIAMRRALGADPQARVLIFDDATGRSVDFDLRGTDAEIAARLAPAKPATAERGAGRPKLGVTAREVTLLPRHWDWLAAQPGGASVTLRKLVDKARGETSATVLAAQAAADRFMATMLGNQPGFEEATRALYAGDEGRFATLSEPWPVGPRDHARRLAGAVWG